MHDTAPKPTPTASAPEASTFTYALSPVARANRPTAYSTKPRSPNNAAATS